MILFLSHAHVLLPEYASTGNLKKHVGFASKKPFIIVIQKTNMIALSSFCQIQIKAAHLKCDLQICKECGAISNFHMDFVAILKPFIV